MNIYSGIILFIGLWCFPAFSAQNKSARLMQYHAINSQITKSLHPRNAQKINSLIGTLSSELDRQMLRKNYIATKGKKISVYPFLDRLVINESGKRYSLQLMSLKPLKVKINNRAIVSIDSNNIYKSINSVLRKTNTASLWNPLLPRAYADENSEESKWLFIYSAFAAPIAKSYNYSGKVTTDPAEFSNQVDIFLKKFDVQKFNCNTGAQATIAGAKAFGVSFTDSKNNRFYAGCGDGTLSSCGVLATDVVGSRDRVVRDVISQQALLKENMKEEANKVANNQPLEMSDFEVRCEMIDGWGWGEHYPACYLDQQRGTYPEELTSALSTTNLLNYKKNDDASYSAKKMIETFTTDEKSIDLKQDHAFVLKSLKECCLQPECAAKAQEKLPMTKEAPPSIK